jgi:Amt family ammonium transporter
MVAAAHRAYDFFMATKTLRALLQPAEQQDQSNEPANADEPTRLNLPENADSPEQRQILDALPVLVFLERTGIIVFANAEARQMLGHAENEWVPRPIEEVLWGLMPGTAEPQTLLTGTKRGSPFHATLPSKNGRLLPVEGTYSITNAELREAVIVAHPGGRERAPKTRLMEDELSSIPEAVAIEHGDHVLYTNPAFTRMFGYSAEEAGGGSLRELIVPETHLDEHLTLARGVKEQGRMMVETVRRNKAGEPVDVKLHVAPLLVDGTQLGSVFTFRDVCGEGEVEARQRHNALHDPLTGLPNEALFLDRLHLALSRRARRPERTCGVLYLDIDRLAEVNDALGHAAGDVLLIAAAERLRGSLRQHDSAARLDGDTFAVLIEELTTKSDLESVAGRMVRELQRPFSIFGHEIQSGATVGAAIAELEHISPDLLIRDAELAMCRSKQAGGGRYEIFNRQRDVQNPAQDAPSGVA